MNGAQEITVREAAARVRRSTETVRRWIWSGRLPAIKHGNTYYVDVGQLDLVAAELGTTESHEPAPPALGAWLAEVDDWRSGLDRAGQDNQAAATASDLVLEDRHARY
jgi:excisionase family DNA binding protein